MILLKNAEEIGRIRTAGKFAMEVLLELGHHVREGVKTSDLEAICEEMIGKRDDIEAAFKGYNGYPYCLCVSVNDEVVHGMPSDGRVLKEGDIVSLDFGTIYKGYYGDAAVTYPVGEISAGARKLLSVTEAALYKGIDEVREGARLHDVS